MPFSYAFSLFSFYFSWLSHWFWWVRSWCYLVNLVSVYLSWASYCCCCLRAYYSRVWSYLHWVSCLFSAFSYSFCFVSSSHWLLNEIKSSLSYLNFFSISYFSVANCSFSCFDWFSNSIWNCFCSVSYLLAFVVNLPLCISYLCFDEDLPIGLRGLSSSSLKDLNLAAGFSASSLDLKTLLVFLYCYCLRAVIWAYCSRIVFYNYWIFAVLFIISTLNCSRGYFKDVHSFFFAASSSSINLLVCDNESICYFCL